MIHRTQENALLTMIYHKRQNSGTAKKKDMHTARYDGRGLEVLCPLWVGRPLSQHLDMFANSEALQISSFVKVSLCRHNRLNYWPMGIEFNLRPPSPFSSSRRVELKVLILESDGLVFRWTAPILKLRRSPPAISHLNSIQKTFLSL